jgi:hypothetical protein
MKILGTRLAATAGCLLFAGTPARSANAEPSLADKTVATQLFNEGRILLDQGRIGEACAKLEESQRIEPGGGTLLNVALCHERQGRTAAAWVEFTEAMGLARRDENALRVEFARSHIALLAPLLSRLAIQVPPGSDIPDLEVKCDGSSLARAAWGSPVPVDPGEHLIEAVAPGRLPWKQSILVGPNADSKTAVVPVLESAPIHVEPVRSSPAASSPGGPVREPPSTAATGSSRLGSASDQGGGRPEGSAAPAWIALTLGFAAAGVGTYFGIRALSEKNDADRACPNNLCSTQGESENSQAIRFANYATAGIAVGAAGVGLATVLFMTRSGAARPAPDAKTAGQSAVPRVQIADADLSGWLGGAELRITGRW